MSNTAVNLGHILQSEQSHVWQNRNKIMFIFSLFQESGLDQRLSSIDFSDKNLTPHQVGFELSDFIAKHIIFLFP